MKEAEVIAEAERGGFRCSKSGSPRRVSTLKNIIEGKTRVTSSGNCVVNKKVPVPEPFHKTVEKKKQERKNKKVPVPEPFHKPVEKKKQERKNISRSNSECLKYPQPSVNGGPPFDPRGCMRMRLVGDDGQMYVSTYEANSKGYLEWTWERV